MEKLKEKNIIKTILKNRKNINNVKHRKNETMFLFKCVVSII